MKLLLDTHAFIWFVEDDENLPERVRLQIEYIENDNIHKYCQSLGNRY